MKRMGARNQPAVRGSAKAAIITRFFFPMVMATGLCYFAGERNAVSSFIAAAPGVVAPMGKPAISGSQDQAASKLSETFEGVKTPGAAKPQPPAAILDEADQKLAREASSFPAMTAPSEPVIPEPPASPPKKEKSETPGEWLQRGVRESFEIGVFGAAMGGVFGVTSAFQAPMAVIIQFATWGGLIAFAGSLFIILYSFLTR